MENEKRVYAGRSLVRDIVTELDAVVETLKPANYYQDQRAAIEESIWSDLYDSYQGGWMTLKEAQDKFMLWRKCYPAVGRGALK